MSIIRWYWWDRWNCTAISRAQVELQRGTGGTGVGLSFGWRERPVPPVTPMVPPKIPKNARSTTGSTGYTRRTTALYRAKIVFRTIPGEHLVNALSWAAIANNSERLGWTCRSRGTGERLPSCALRAARTTCVPPQPAPCPADAPASTRPIVAAAKKAGVIFMERVSDGELIVEGLDRLAPDDRQKLEAGRSDIHRLLLPNDTSTASIDLLTNSALSRFMSTTSSALLRRCSGFAQQRPRLDWTSRPRRYRSIFRSLAHSRNERR